MSRHFLLPAALLFAAALVTTDAPANISASANFTLRSAVLNNGAGEQASTNFRVNGSLGEAAIGGAGSASFVLSAGYFANTLGGLPAMLNLISVFSTKMHGPQGPFNVPIDIAQVVGGAVSVEPRAMGSGHTIVFRFDSPVVTAGTVTARDAAMVNVGSATASASGNDVVVTLTGIPDRQRVALSLTGVNGGTNANAAVGFLLGDVNGTRAVVASDIAAVKASQGQTATSTNYRLDLNASGTISAADLALVKSRAGSILP